PPPTLPCPSTPHPPPHATADFFPLAVKIQQSKSARLSSPTTSLKRHTFSRPPPCPGNKTPAFCPLNCSAQPGQHPPHAYPPIAPHSPCPMPHSAFLIPPSAFPIPHSPKRLSPRAKSSIMRDSLDSAGTSQGGPPPCKTSSSEPGSPST